MPRTKNTFTIILQVFLALDLLFLIFISVIKTNQVLAVGQMSSFISEDNFNYWWEPNKWKSQFKVNWHYIKDIPYKDLYHIKLEDDKPVVKVRDGTEIPWTHGK